jgi:UDP-2-acetamido-3-amino-2,3-dideoxy-glucuronate N-acetyltransferase
MSNKLVQVGEYLVHPQALCETSAVGANTRVWAFAHVLPGATLGANCNICDHVFIEDDVVVGDRVTIKCGVQLWNGLRIADDVFIGPNASFTNDRFPRSKQYPEQFDRTTVESGASIGANATILSGLTIGRGAMIGAGSVVTKDVPPNAVVVGNPARIVGYANAKSAESTLKTLSGDSKKLELGVGGAYMQRFPRVQDLRGSLSFGEFGLDHAKPYIPFAPKRFFLVFDVPTKDVRGEHAHKQCHQFLVCVSGSVTCLVDDGDKRAEVELNQPELGLYMPPGIWGSQYRYSDNAVLLVFTSEYYSAEDYIRHYDEFLEFKRAGTSLG